MEGRLAGLELSITEEGVTYRSVAGAFPAPWSAVRRTVARAVHHLSDGRITVTSPAFKDP